MSKNKKIISIFLILFIILQPFKAAADPEVENNSKMPANFTVNIDISEVVDFDGVIYVYIYDSQGKINVFGLNKKNNFTNTYQIAVGQAELYKVLIEDCKGTELRMEYTTQGDLMAIENSKKNKFTIKLKKGFEENTNETQQDNNAEEKTQEEIEEESIKQEQQEQKEKSREKRRMINFIMDGFLIVLVGAIWLYLKYKDKKREKESGEK